MGKTQSVKFPKAVLDKAQKTMNRCSQTDLDAAVVDFAHFPQAECVSQQDALATP